jgi:excisionase family DNA binding protein
MRDPLLVSPKEASAMLDMSRAQLFKLLASGDIPSIKIGKLRRIELAEMQKWIARYRSEQEDDRAAQ